MAKLKGIKLNMSMDCKKAIRTMNKMPEWIDQANVKTVRDVKKRIPAQVRKGIKEAYKVDKEGLDESLKPGKVKYNDRGDYLEVTIGGNRLSLAHFGLTPKKQPTARKEKRMIVPGYGMRGEDFIMFHQPRRYSLRYEIERGQRKVAPPGHSFVAKVNGKDLKPWKRLDDRDKIVMLKGTAVPTMIEHKAEKPVHENINKMVSERKIHYLDQIEKKI
jgi:hypothetical protein